jgi:membrane-associated phospholipid phosphatase
MRSSVRLLLLSSAGCAVLLTALLVAVYDSAQGRWLDNAALSGFLSLINTPGDKHLANAVVYLCNAAPFALMALAIVAVAIARGLPRRAAAAAAVLFGSVATTELLKPALAQVRFDPHVVGLGHVVSPHIPAPAFPSGHATAAMALALAGLIVAPRALRPLVAAGGAFFALTLGCLLVALGWHFPSDVVGGYLVATAWCLATIAGLRAADARWPERGTIRAAARTRAPAVAEVLAPVGALIAALGIGVGLARLDRINDFAHTHTTATVAAVAISVCATALVAAVSLADQRAR